LEKSARKIKHPNGRDVFVQRNAIEGDGYKTLVAGEFVQFEAEENPHPEHKGQLCFWQAKSEQFCHSKIEQVSLSFH
jgi:cold shock CspA family protein